MGLFSRIAAAAKKVVKAVKVVGRAIARRFRRKRPKRVISEGEREVRRERDRLKARARRAKKKAERATTAEKPPGALRSTWRRLWRAPARTAAEERRAKAATDARAKSERAAQAAADATRFAALPKRARAALEDALMLAWDGDVVSAAVMWDAVARDYSQEELARWGFATRGLFAALVGKADEDDVGWRSLTGFARLSDALDIIALIDARRAELDERYEIEGFLTELAVIVKPWTERGRR